MLFDLSLILRNPESLTQSSCNRMLEDLNKAEDRWRNRRLFRPERRRWGRLLVILLILLLVGLVLKEVGGIERIGEWLRVTVG